MADIKISQLGAASVVADSDVFPMTAGGATVKAPASVMKEYMVGDIDISAIGDGTVTGAIYTDNALLQSVLGDFATVEANTIASKAYIVGKYLILNGLLYRVTSAIAYAGTITVNTNVVLTTVAEEMANKILDFTVTVQAGTGDLATLSDARITANHVVAGRNIAWGNSSAITSDVTVTTTAGQAVINGTCTAQTTATFTLIRKDN